MTCGVLSENNIRTAAAVRENVPWKSRDEVAVKWLEHDGEHYWAILYYPLGVDQPPVCHSGWKTRTAANTFLRVNPGSANEG